MRPRKPLPPHLSRRAFGPEEARAAGLGRHRMLGRDINRPFRGVYLPASIAPTLQARCAALAPRLHPSAFFCGATAARLLGAPLPARLEKAVDVHVAVTLPAPIPTGKHIRGHSAEVLAGDVVARGPLRLSSPERVFCELASVLDLGDLVAVGDYLVHWRLPLTDVSRLSRRVAAFATHRGCRRAREALLLLDERSESRKESLLRVIVVTAGLPQVVANLPIRTRGGFRYRADLAFVGAKVVVEYQSAYHDDIERYRADQTRRSRLEADGWYVIEVNDRDLDDPVELISRIRHVLASREM